MNIATSFPVLDGNVVTQGHADYCNAHGHATHTIVGTNAEIEIAPYCPRCGTRLTSAALNEMYTEELNKPTNRQDVQRRKALAAARERAVKDEEFRSRKRTTEPEIPTVPQAVKNAAADATEIRSNSSSPVMFMEFRTKEIAALHAEQLKRVAKNVEIRPNPIWISYEL